MIVVYTPILHFVMFFLINHNNQKQTALSVSIAMGRSISEPVEEDEKDMGW